MGISSCDGTYMWIGPVQYSVEEEKLRRDFSPENVSWTRSARFILVLAKDHRDKEENTNNEMGQ